MYPFFDQGGNDGNGDYQWAIRLVGLSEDYQVGETIRGLSEDYQVGETISGLSGG